MEGLNQTEFAQQEKVERFVLEHLGEEKKAICSMLSEQYPSLAAQAENIIKDVTVLPWTDSHEHIEYREPVAATIQRFQCIFQIFNYRSILLLSVFDLLERAADPLNELKNLAVKKVLAPNVYVFSCLRHFYDERDTEEGYRNQVRDAWEAGFDGLKLFELKPGMRKKLGRALSDPIFDPMFAYLEENNIPVTIHAGDPADFWGNGGENRLELIRRGWLYDESYPPRHQIYEEILEVMQKHPSLRLTVAHLMCDEESVDAATAFLSDYPNTAYDMTACASEYTIAGRDPDRWKEFFLNFSDRLYFGTDMCNTPEPGEYLRNCWGRNSALLSRVWLHSREDFEMLGKNFRSLSLPEEVSKKILYENFYRRLSSSPRKIDFEKVRILLEEREEELRAGAYGPAVRQYLAEDLSCIGELKEILLQSS